MILASEHGLEIHLHARLGRTPAEQAKRITGEFRFRDKRRQPGKQQHGDGPGREVNQQGAVAHERDAVLHEPEGTGDKAQGSGRGLAARARQLVIELRVLEVPQLEREGLLEDHDVDSLPKLGAQQRLAQRQAALSRRDRGDQCAFQNDEFDHARGLGAAGADRQ